MFFSLDPNAFRHPKRCNLTNGTEVYLNGSHHLGLDCSCAAPFAADPDISGAAIMASFFFMAWFSVALAIIPTAHGLVSSWRRSYGPYKFFKFVADILQLRSQREELPEQPKNTPPLVSRQSTRSTFSQDLSKLSPVFPPRDSTTPTTEDEPAAVTFCRKLMYPVCDIQIITGLAMLITGVATFPKISFYYEQFVVNYWWLTLNSLWVSRIDYTTASPMYNGLRYDLRRLTILASVVLSCTFQGLVAARENNDWDPVSSGRCYVSSYLGGADYGQNLFWLAGTALYGVVLLATLTPWSRSWLYSHVTGRLEPGLTAMTDWVMDTWMAVTAYRRSARESQHSWVMRASTTVALTAKAIGCSIVWVSWWLLVQFLSIWSSGNGSFVIELIVYCVFAGFLTWWLIFLRVQNKMLVQGSQDHWTFASTLALAVVGFAIFFAADVWKEVRDERLERARKRVEDDEAPPDDLKLPQREAPGMQQFVVE